MLLYAEPIRETETDTRTEAEREADWQRGKTEMEEAGNKVLLGAIALVVLVAIAAAWAVATLLMPA